VPLQDPRQGAAELRRAVADLDLCGALVNDHTLGHYLDEPQYEPFWEALQDIGGPLYIHPNPVQPDQWKIFDGYPGLDFGAWGWNHRTGGHAMRLIFGGVFDKFPGARIILGHMGEFLPAQLPRVDLGYSYLVMFSVDYPFESTRQATEFIHTAPLAAADKARVAHTNAELILRLTP
jgi:2,3-dihydroxybenzoate decarboxylase